MNYAVILAGGRGERFWPLSTAARPKQFISIFGGKPLIAHAVDRLEGLVPPERTIIITSADLVEASRAAAPQLPSENVIGEPCPRDTAAAVALACGVVAARDKDGVVAILTADQLMIDVPLFRETLGGCFQIARESKGIVTIGIKPEYPATGFGYIEAADEINPGFFKAKRFVEKPNAEKAAEYIAAGNFYWNAGMFIWHVETMSTAIKRFTPELAALLEPCDLGALYPTLKKISIDFAVMEHYDNIIVARGTFGWDDVGTWQSVAPHLGADENENTILGNCIAAESRGNIVISEKPIALLGVEDLVVVQTPNATLICPKARAQEIKKLHALLPAELK